MQEHVTKASENAFEVTVDKIERIGNWKLDLS